MPVMSDAEIGLGGGYLQPKPLSDEEIGVKSKLLSDDEVMGTTKEGTGETLLKATAGAMLGNDPRGAIKLGPLSRMDAGDFYTDPEGELRAISTQDFIARDDDGELAVFAMRPKTTVMDKVGAVSSAVMTGVATESVGRLGSMVSKAPKAAKVTEDVAELTPEQALQSKIDKAGNINLRRIYAPDDVKQVIRDTAIANEEFIGARRGVMSHEQTREMASLVGLTPEKLARRVEGQAFNAEEMFAARELLARQATKVKDIAQKAQGGSDIDKLNFAEEMTRLVAIQEQVSGATAEAGRTLQQFRMMARGDKEEVARLLEAQKANNLDDMIGLAAKYETPEQVAAFIANGYKAKTTDMLLEAWINGLLSGPTTHATNILSNSLVSLWAIPESLASAGVSKITGSGIGFREALGKAFGMIEGAKDGIRAGARTFATEQPTDLASKMDVRRYRSIPGVAGQAVRLPSRALMAEDEFFKSIGYRQEINALAYRQATKEGLEGAAFGRRVAQLKAAPTDEMKKAGRSAAEKQTFTNPLGSVGKKILGIGREVPAFRVVAPFIRTPVNILKFAAERSPFAPLMKEVRQNLRGVNGAAARDQQIARIGLGSATGAAVAYEAMKGNVTGGGPADPRARAVLYASGWQPYSVKVGDNYYSYGRLEPLGMLMGVSADFVELSENLSADEEQNLASLIVGSVQKNLVSKTWLRGLSDVIEAWNDPDRYGAQYIQNLAGSLVPTGVAQWARTQDPFLREARTILDKIKDRLPGYREELPNKRDIFGDPIELGGSVGPDILSPIYKSAAKNDPVVAELVRLRVTPSRPSRLIRGVELEPQEYEVMQEATGSTVRKGLSAIINDPSWPELPDETQRDLIDQVWRKSRDVGRATVLTQFPAVVDRIRTQRTQTP